MARPRRAPRGAAAPPTSPRAGPRETDEPLVSLVARAADAAEALSAIHARALHAAGGSCSVLFSWDGRTERLHATSGFAIDELETEGWTPAPLEQRLIDDVFEDTQPVLIHDAVSEAPGLAARLPRARAVLLLPLVNRGVRAGLLAIGLPQPAGGPAPGLSGIADALVVTFDLFRLREHEALQQELGDLLDEFSATVSATLDVGAGFELVCRRANRLFGAERTAVWLHEREAERLVLRASSDRAHAAASLAVGRDDLLAPAAAAMRRSRSLAMHGHGATRTIAVPLRGYRRALGALVLEGVRVDAADEASLLDRADEVGRQLSSAIDSLQLLDDVLGARRDLEALFDSMPALVVVSDRDGRIVHVNDTFARRCRTTRERLLGRTLAECVGPELGPWLDRQARGTRSVESSTREISDPILGGPLFVTASARLDRDRRRSGLVVIAQDAPPGQTRDVERSRLAQTEKLSALGQFVAGIAHELNNPLQGVLGHIELLRATQGFPKTQRPALKAIHREADRAAKIVRNLLAFSGSRRLSRRAISINKVLQGVVALRRVSGGADVEVVRHYAAHVPRIEGDPLLLHQVFLNLMLNAEEAVGATGQRGRIEVATSVLPGGGEVRVTIRDTGRGIPPDALERVFEPFFTTKDVGKGTGLGLPIAYGIVQEHGGRISAANHREGGAVITVDLPAVPARAGRS